MKRIAKILQHAQFIKYMNNNKEAEQERIFCCHDLRHAVDVARVAYILVLEDQKNIPRSIVYGAALLHDIGRWREYAEGVNHAIESANLAEEILKDTGFNYCERETIIKAISEHRKEGEQSTYLSAILYKSDKISRPCVECSVIDQCKRFSDGRQPELDY